jgi:hypothetical protein
MLMAAIAYNLKKVLKYGKGKGLFGVKGYISTSNNLFTAVISHFRKTKRKIACYFIFELELNLISIIKSFSI